MKHITRSFMQETFKHYCQKYAIIFSSFYPARGSSGFTEANQIHLFVNSLAETLSEKCLIQWLEFPWAKKSQHIDAFVYSKEHKSVFYIEAKRLYNEKKRQELLNDMGRIIYQSNRDTIKNAYELSDVDEYAISLCDVWLEDKWEKRKIPSWWKGEPCKAFFSNGDLEGVLDSDRTFIDDIKSPWPKRNQFIKRFSSSDNPLESCLKNYCIMMGYVKI